MKKIFLFNRGHLGDSSISSKAAWNIEVTLNQGHRGDSQPGPPRLLSTMAIGVTPQSLSTRVTEVTINQDNRGDSTPLNQEHHGTQLMHISLNV